MYFYYALSFLTNQEQLFNLKFAVKDLERNAKKCDKAEKEEKLKLKKVIKYLLKIELSLCQNCSVVQIATQV